MCDCQKMKNDPAASKNEIGTGKVYLNWMVYS